MVICPLGALACLFLFFQAFQEHWKVFVGWTVIGLAIYFGYGIHHSRLAKRANLLSRPARDAGLLVQ